LAVFYDVRDIENFLDGTVWLLADVFDRAAKVRGEANLIAFAELLTTEKEDTVIEKGLLQTLYGLAI
jgi:hypothetical protein